MYNEEKKLVKNLLSGDIGLRFRGLCGRRRGDQGQPKEQGLSQILMPALQRQGLYGFLRVGRKGKTGGLYSLQTMRKAEGRRQKIATDIPVGLLRAVPPGVFYSPVIPASRSGSRAQPALARRLGGLPCLSEYALW